MGKDNLQKREHHTFADIRQTDDLGAEFWYARDLQHALQYAEWRNFEKVINKAITACNKAGYDPNDHFVGVTKKARNDMDGVQTRKDFF